MNKAQMISQKLGEAIKEINVNPNVATGKFFECVKEARFVGQQINIDLNATAKKEKEILELSDA